MSAPAIVPDNGPAVTCTVCGQVFWRKFGHSCPGPRRFNLAPAYVDRQWRLLVRQLETPGRHARPESGGAR